MNEVDRYVDDCAIEESNKNISLNVWMDKVTIQLESREKILLPFLYTA